MVVEGIDIELVEDKSDHIREEIWDFHRENVLAELATSEQERESEIQRFTPFFPHLLQQARFETCQYWLALGDGQLVGCVGLCPDDEEEGLLWVTTLSVKKEARGRGLGTALLAQAMASPQVASCSTLRLATNNVFQAAKRIYHRAGFEVIKEWDVGHLIEYLMEWRENRET